MGSEDGTRNFGSPRRNELKQTNGWRRDDGTLVLGFRISEGVQLWMAFVLVEGVRTGF